MVSGWIKAVFFLVILVIGILVVVWLLPSRRDQQVREKTFYDVTAKDDARLRAEPVVKGQAQGAEQSKPKFKELSEEEQVEAEKLFEMAVMERKMGRLPALGYNRMVEYCRQIIRRFPGSEYEFKAKRILADIPEQYRSQYKITAEEIDLGDLQ